MQYRPPNANLESGSQTVSIVSGDNWWRHLVVVGGRTWTTLACFFVDCGHAQRILLVTQLRYTDEYIVNIMKVYIDRNNLQLESMRYSIKC